MSKISICVGSAHSDYGMKHLPDLHIFEYLMRSLRKQTFKDFEVVITDVLYEQRKNYFKEHHEDFVVKHVPVKPNIWIPRGLFGISTSKNTSLLYASGDIVVYTGDCTALPPNFLEIIVEKVKPNYCIESTYDCYFGDKKEIGLSDPRKPGMVPATYGYVSLCMEDALDLNGYNEMFDGSKGLEDCNFGRRMYVKGMDIELIDSCPIHHQQHGVCPSFSKSENIKCARLMEMLSVGESRKNVYRANSTPYTEEEIGRLLECSYKVKGDRCEYVYDADGLGYFCTSGINKEGTSKYGDVDKIKYMYTHPSLIFDLREQRKNIPEALKKLEELCKE